MTVSKPGGIGHRVEGYNALHVALRVHCAKPTALAVARRGARPCRGRPRGHGASPVSRLVVCVLALDGREAAERAVSSARRFGLDVAVGVVGEEGGECPDGVNVHRLEWRDDFADARNQLAAQVTADWLLWIDPDEALVAFQDPALDRLDEPFAGVWLEDRKDHTPRPAIRLQRRRPDVRWWGAVNETLVAKEGGPLVILDEVRLKSFGYEDSQLARRKLERNHRIASLRRAAGADDFGLALEGARCAEAAEHGSAAFVAWLRAFKHPGARPPWAGAPDPRVEIAEQLCAYDYTKPALRLLEDNPEIVSLHYALLAADRQAERRADRARPKELAGRLVNGQFDRRYSFPREFEGKHARRIRYVILARLIGDVDRPDAGRDRSEPLRVGRFVIVPAQAKTSCARRFLLRIDAGFVFGTGEHPGTRGALVAIDRLARRRRFRRVLDVGSGSGILAIAAAKAWPARVTAVDVNPVAAEQARRNIRANALGRRARAVVTYGLWDGRLPRGTVFDLAVANLDAKGLLLYATALSRRVAPGGMVVLTGLGTRDERRVASVYRALGLQLRAVLRWNPWSTMIMEAPRSRRRATTQRADRRLHRFGRARR